MRKRRWFWLLGVPVFALAVLLWWHFRQPKEQSSYTGQFSDVLEKSTDVPRDLKLMWETQPLQGTPDPTHGPNPHASTDKAIEAASRVFNTVKLVGKSREEVVALLGDPKSSNNSVYNFPFWPIRRGALVYRFDCGSYGWQFNVLFDGSGKAKEVQRAWIH